MALPQGFNPNSMSFGDLAAGRPAFRIPRNGQRPVRPAARTVRRPSLWARFNKGVTDIGNWFADNTDNIILCLRLLAIIPIIIIYIQLIIEAYNEHGFAEAIISLFASVVAGYMMWKIISAIITILVNIIAYVVRFIFWNGWTLLLVIGLIAYVCITC